MVRELMQVQLTDRTVRDRLIHTLSFELMFASSQPQTHTTADYFFSLFTDTQLQLNPELLGKFSNLLLTRTETREEDIQQFLFAHPIFLYSTWRLKYAASTSSGSEFITDFCALSELITSTCSLKIERSTDNIFTGKGVLHSELMESAVGQVRDFQAWTHDNIAYARTRLAGHSETGRPRRHWPTRDAVTRDARSARRGELQSSGAHQDNHFPMTSSTRPCTIYGNLISRPLRVARQPNQATGKKITTYCYAQRPRYEVSVDSTGLVEEVIESDYLDVPPTTVILLVEPNEHLG